jgi:L-rhamnose mutarotase
MREERAVSRVCFTLQLNPDRLDEYRRRHAAVWPEMLEALRDTGWRDYSLYLRDDGLLVGVVETDDFDAIRAAMETTDVNARWQAEMAPFFTGLDDRRPDEGMQRLPEIFNLDRALEHARTGGATS